MDITELSKLQYTRVESCNVAKKAIYRFAEGIAEQIDFGSNDDIGEIVEKLGGEISYFHLEKIRKLHGSIFIHETGKFDIALPVFTNSRQDRFTIAHELGHYFLHEPRSKAFAARQAYVQESDDRAEWEANWFAAGFLMPTKAFGEALEQFPDRDDSDVPNALAVQFGVSREAATIRLRDYKKNVY